MLFYHDRQHSIDVYLPIKIINPENQKEINVFALIDTGADECALPASFASLLVGNIGVKP